MTVDQAKAEINYRLARYILYCLRDRSIISSDTAEQARRIVCEKYKPFTYSLEVDIPWKHEK